MSAIEKATVDDGDDKPAWSVKRLADFWDCSTDQIYVLIKRGELQTFSIGHGMRGKRITDKERRRWEESGKLMSMRTAMSDSDGPGAVRSRSTLMKAVAAARG